MKKEKKKNPLSEVENLLEQAQTLILSVKLQKIEGISHVKIPINDALFAVDWLING